MVTKIYIGTSLDRGDTEANGYIIRELGICHKLHSTISPSIL